MDRLDCSIEIMKVEKQTSTGVLRKSCSENMQQIYKKIYTLLKLLFGMGVFL